MTTLGRVAPLLSLRDIFPVSSGHLPRNRRRSGLHKRAYSNLRVCSPVEAGEVARVAWRRGGDLPKVATLTLAMTE